MPLNTLFWESHVGRLLLHSNLMWVSHGHQDGHCENRKLALIGLGLFQQGSSYVLMSLNRLLTENNGVRCDVVHGSTTIQNTVTYIHIHAHKHSLQQFPFPKQE